MAGLTTGSPALEHLYVRGKTEIRHLRELREWKNHSDCLNKQQGSTSFLKSFPFFAEQIGITPRNL